MKINLNIVKKKKYPRKKFFNFNLLSFNLRNKMRGGIYFCLIVIITLGISISSQSLLAKWTNPIIIPPGSNLPEPINVSNSTQYKLGKLGVGLITLPNESLEIGDGGIAANTSKIRITDIDNNPELQLQYGGNANDHWAVYNNRYDNNSLNIWGNGENRLTILQNGNVSIGTSSLSSILDINGSFTVRGMAEPNKSLAGQGRIYFDSTKNTFLISENGGAYNGLNQWDKNGSYLSYNNRVGIGTTTPNNLLHIYDTTKNAELDIQSVAGVDKHWGIYQDQETADLRFWQGDNRLVITKNGDIGIGTTTPTGAKLVVNGTISALSPTADNQVATKSYVDAKSSSGSTNKMQVFDKPGTFTWVKPDNVSMVYVTMVGGGGGGGSGNASENSNSNINGGGGGGGEGVIRYPYFVSNDITVIVGVGGNGGEYGWCKMEEYGWTCSNGLGNGYSGKKTSFGFATVLNGEGGKIGGAKVGYSIGGKGGNNMFREGYYFHGSDGQQGDVNQTGGNGGASILSSGGAKGSGGIYGDGSKGSNGVGSGGGGGYSWWEQSKHRSTAGGKGGDGIVIVEWVE